jgi:HlyD family secretion protein
MKWFLFLLVTIALSAAASVGAVYWAMTHEGSPLFGLHEPKKAPEPVEPPVPDLPRVVALGTLKPKGGVIHVSGMAGERLSEVKVDEGDDVKRGDVLAVLESHTLREIEQKAAVSAVEEAEGQLPIERAVGDAQVAEAEVNIESVELRKGDITSQEDKINALKKNLTVAEADQKRLAELDEAIVSEQQREKQGLLVEQAKAELAAADQMLTRLQETYQFEKKLAEVKLRAAKANRDRMVAALQIDARKQQVELANAKLALSEVRAPVDGRILNVMMQPGETTGQKPILSLGKVDTMYAVAEVYETDIGRVQKGQAAKITGDALIDPATHKKYELTGKVVSIGTTVSNNEVRSLDPTDRGDLRVVEVNVEIDPQFREAASRLINLQVTVRIETPAQPASEATPTPATQAQR